MKTNDFSSASNAKRAAVGAKIPSEHIVITKQPNGRFTFADARATEAVPYAFAEGTNSAGEPGVEPTARKPARLKHERKEAAKAEPKAKPAKAPKAEPKPKAESKQDRLIALLKRPEGASVTELAAEFGWQLHTVRGVVAGALKRKLGIPVEATQNRERGGVVYRVK